jgi:DNA invertase Pin-like site-specific DNA recombinase
MTTKSPPVYAYIRWSTDEQAKGDSERRQTEGARKYAERQGWQLSDEVIITDAGLSAFTGENVSRGNLGRLLKDVEAGKIPKGSVILVENLDRLSREGIDLCRDIIRTFTKADIEVRTINDGIIYNAKTFGLIEHVMSGVKSYLAKDESDKKSGRVRDAWETKRTQAKTQPLTKRCPAWLRLLENGKFEVLEDRSKVVRQIFEQSAAGIGTYTITRDLNGRRVPPFGSSGELACTRFG